MRVLQCESTCVAGEARTRAAWVTSVLYTRVVVYRAQRGKRGRGGGEDEAVANPGAHIRKSGEIGKSGNREIGKSGNREIEIGNHGDRSARATARDCEHEGRDSCCRSARCRRARYTTRPAVQCKRQKCTRSPNNVKKNQTRKKRSALAW